MIYRFKLGPVHSRILKLPMSDVLGGWAFRQLLAKVTNANSREGNTHLVNWESDNWVKQLPECSCLSPLPTEAGRIFFRAAFIIITFSQSLGQHHFGLWGKGLLKMESKHSAHPCTCQVPQSIQAAKEKDGVAYWGEKLFLTFLEAVTPRSGRVPLSLDSGGHPPLVCRLLPSLSSHGHAEIG